ncbi:MAG: dephospho-CoA kinase [Chlamydiota bacterium]|nr:dephospho-CoA kinase [Chlamydiota bacterium]
MLKLRKIAVTGGISSGKSLFCLYLKELGAFVVSADRIVHQLLSPKTNLGKKVIKLLGPEVLTNNEINRDTIAQMVFNDSQLLQSLEQILHPEVFLQIDKEYTEAKKQGAKLFVAEIPLLFEANGEAFFDATVTITSDENRCIERFIKKTARNEEQYHARMARQLPQREKAERANYVIYNNGSKEDLRVEAVNFFENILNWS